MNTKTKPYLLYAFTICILAIRCFGSPFIVAKQFKDHSPQASWSESLEASLMFRYAGDISYYPQISSLAKGNIQEPVLANFHAEFISGFPLLSTAPFSLGQKFFGPLGILIADFLLSFICFLLIRRCLILLSFPQNLAGLSSLVFVSGILNYFLQAGHTIVNHIPFSIFTSFILFCMCMGLIFKFTFKLNSSLKFLIFLSLALVTLVGGEFSYEDPSILWMSRIPRPLGTQIYFWMIFVCLITLVTSKSLQLSSRSRLVYEIVSIVSLGFLLQGDFHSFISMAIFTGGILIYLNLLGPDKITDPRKILQILKKVIIYLAAFLLSIAFFIYQQLHTSPDLALRLGLTDIPRFPLMFFIDSPREIFSLIFWTTSFGILALQIRSNKKLQEFKQGYFITISALGLLAILGILSPTILQLTLAKTIQPSQFMDRFRMFMGLMLFAQGISIVFVAWRMYKPKTLSNQCKLKSLATCSVIFIALIASLYNAYSNSKKEHHVRSNYPEFSKYENSYKSDFFDLIRNFSTYLDNDHHQNITFASYDVAVYSWATSFADLKSFLVDPFLSLAPDSIMEERIQIFMKILGISTEDYIAYIQRFYFLTLWLGHLKYQPTPYILNQDFSSLESLDREKLKKLSSFDAWDVVIPSKEQNRLKNNYSSFSINTELDLPDYIINWKQDELLKDQSMMDSRYQMIYENRTFILWQKLNLNLQ